MYLDSLMTPENQASLTTNCMLPSLTQLNCGQFQSIIVVYRPMSFSEWQLSIEIFRKYRVGVPKTIRFRYLQYIGCLWIIFLDRVDFDRFSGRECHFQQNKSKWYSPQTNMVIHFQSLQINQFDLKKGNVICIKKEPCHIKINTRLLLCSGVWLSFRNKP